MPYNFFTIDCCYFMLQSGYTCFIIIKLTTIMYCVENGLDEPGHLDNVSLGHMNLHVGQSKISE